MVVSPETSVDLTKTAKFASGEAKATSDVAKALESLIEKVEGKVVSKDDWGVRELAYPIRKQTKGIYWFYIIELAAEAVVKLDKGLRLMPEILRYLILCAEG